MRFAIDTDVSGALNATAPTPVRQADFSKALADELGVRAFLPAPTFALKIALGEFSVEVLGSRRVVPERTQEVGFVYRHPRLEDALAELLG
jgi:NAD dependent epimerase/dehydratase family enzyme